MKLDRRAFLKSTALAAPVALGGCRLFEIGYAQPHRPDPSARVTLALVGCGIMGVGNMQGFLQDKRVQVVAVCDPILSAPKYNYDAMMVLGANPARDIVNSCYGNKDCRVVRDFREIAADPSIDAVVVATPDHWHALIAIAMMKAGTHVYCQKPMSLGISEGKEMVRVAKKSGVTFQVGSQQRNGSEFRSACELVRNGYLGECRECVVGLPGGNGGIWGHQKDRTRMAAPAYFDPGMWDLWQGPARHWENNEFIVGIHEPMCWRWNSRTGGGQITDWGAHHFDILHWAIGEERRGPVEIANMKTNLDDDPIFDWAGEYSFDLKYAGGFTAHVSGQERNGLRFIGSKGELFVGRGHLELPDHLKKWRERDLTDGEVHLYRAAANHSHESDFIDGIYENRAIATDCEIGHRSITPAHLANICERLRLPGLKWDPVAERVVGNADAQARLEVPHANGWTL